MDPGVFVITQVDSCRGGRGYCVLGFNCNIDKDFVADDLNGHCDGLGRAFNPITNFVCCRENPANFNLNILEEVTTTTTTTTPTTTTTSVETSTVTSIVTNTVTELSTFTELVTKIEEVTAIDEFTSLELVTTPDMALVDMTTVKTLDITTEAESATDSPMMKLQEGSETPTGVEQSSNFEEVPSTEAIEKADKNPLDSLVSSLLEAVVPPVATEMPMAPPLPISASVIPNPSALTELRLVDEQEEAEETEILRPGQIIDDPTLLEDLMIEQNEPVRPRIDDTESLVDVIGGFEPQFYDPQEHFKSTNKPNDQRETKVDCYAAILLGIECKPSVPEEFKVDSSSSAKATEINSEKITDEKSQETSGDEDLESFPPGEPQALVDESRTEPPMDLTTIESTTEMAESMTTIRIVEDVLDDEIKTSMIDMKPERDDPLIKMTTDPSTTSVMEETTMEALKEQVTSLPNFIDTEDLTPIGIVQVDTERPEHIELPDEILMTNPTSMPLSTTEPTDVKSAYRRITDEPNVKKAVKPDTCGVLGGKGLLQAFGKAAEGLLPDLVASWVTGHHGGKEQKSSEFIGGGVVTSTVIYCWMAAIMTEVNGQKEFLCTGTLIKTDVVLVSATCATELVNRNPSDVKVVVGDSNLSIDLPFGVQTLDVSMIHIHEQFSPYITDLEHNIGLILLKKKASLTNTVCLLCPPSSQIEPELNQKCSIVSYGKIVENPIDLPFEVASQKSTGILRKSEYIIRDPLECGTNVNRTDGMLCAQEIENLTLDEQRHKREHCHIVIDSGSPLICQNNDRFELRGLLTGGHTCLGPNEEVTFTKVEPYVTWIESKSFSKS